MPASQSRRIVITQRFFDDDAVGYLEARGCEVVVPAVSRDAGDGHLDDTQLAVLLEGAAGWIIGQARVTRALIQARPEVLVLSRRGVGYDRIDVAAAAELGRVVTIAAGGNHDAVADHTMALILAVLYRLRESQTRMQAGDWSIPVSSNLFRKTVGLVGFGRIARSVLKRLGGFEVECLVHAGSHHARAITDLGGTPMDLPTLLRDSDVVTLHAPLTAETRFMIDKTTLSLMKPTAILVNTARGGLVQDADLLAALTSGHLAGAGLDVFASESDPAFADVTTALIARSDVVTTAHGAASSREGIALANRIASDNILAVLDGGSPPADCVIVDGRR